MSTKIFNGFMFKGSLMDAHKAFMDLRKEIEPLLLREYHKLFADNLITKYDAYYGGLTTKKPESVMFKFWDELNDRQKKIRATSQRDPAIDFGFEIVLLPISNRKILGVWFTEQSWMETLLTSKPYFQYYGYWNNTDPDDSCTTRQWNQRRRDWDKAWPGYSAPAQHGMTFSLVPDNSAPIVRVKHVVEFIPDMQKRADKVAGELIWRKRFNTRFEGRGYDDTLIRDVTRAMREHKDYLQTRHGQQAKSYFAALTMPKLLTVEQLLEVYK